jgi:hypothetical protein
MALKKEMYYSIDGIRAELVWCVRASEILVTADSNYFISCTFTKPHPLCQLQAGHSFANSVTPKKPTNKFSGVFGVHQFLLAGESRVHPGISFEPGIINWITP